MMVLLVIYQLLILLQSFADTAVPTTTRVTSLRLMTCSYGERGSLTATCVNATPSYFKSTPYRFDNLDETLRCVNCALQTLDSGTFDLSGNQIRTLDLTHSSIATIQQRAFVGLIFLERLLLAYNDIKSIFPGTFIGVKKIHYIDLSHNQISMLSDDGFLELLNLDTLILRHNRITAIQMRSFAGLSTGLRTLDLAHNHIQSVNEKFDNLTGLQVLNLSYNNVTAVSGNDFNNLTSLLAINFANNRIRAIPNDEFVTMKSLRQLDMSNNTISVVNVDSFRGLESLEDLDLSSNNISSVQQRALQSLHNLRNLNCSLNAIRTFQTGLYSGLPQLRVLNLSYNAIESVEITGVFSLHSLHALDLSNNNISDIEYVSLVYRLPSINYLNLANNQLPCSLEQEMETYFAEDNFKFLLYQNKVGAVVCVQDTPISDKIKSNHVIHQYQINDVNHNSSTATVWMFILITVCLISIGVLFFLHYSTIRDLKQSHILRATSQVQLISSDLESRDRDYLKD